MLNDSHLKVLSYEQNSSNVFANTDIKGGVAITYRDAANEYGAIGVFSHFEELRSILAKIKPVTHSLTDIIYLQNRFNLDALYSDHPEFKCLISSDGKERRIVSSSFEKLSVFSDEYSDNAIRIWGVANSNNRVLKYIDRNYVEDNGNLHKWKIIVPKANGSGALGEILSTPLIGEPLIGYTQTFIGIGSFDSEIEAKAAMKYVKSKFARTLLGILKITQDNPPEKWRFVPLQDFTPSSDIDWSVSVAEIDRQLYKKYNLSEEEIAFIETHVKEMQ